MAKLFPILTTFLLFFFFSSSSCWAHSEEQMSSFLRSEKRVEKAAYETQSHFQFFWHDIVSGPSPTSVRVAQAPSEKNSTTSFGTIVMIDDPLTVGPNLSSPLVGHAQGLYSFAGKDSVGLLMAMTFVFAQGDYANSTIVIMGRNDVFSQVREMAVVGGSGLFRLARGYAQARTHTFDQTTGYTVVQYDVFVTHS
ncbi:dirigent protein 22-like [Ananas comosus]|uniref:Dirigent protein n=1 Tax=Ananas comosus TaxID=4615 RepID=A0A6P5GFF1_ANACO|nr:dirigent protein 22-like [Ananas comosus]